MRILKIMLVKSHTTPQPFFTQIAKIERILGINCCLCSLLPVIAPLPDDDVVDCMKRSERGALTTKTIAAGSAAAALLQAGAEDSDHSPVGL